MGRKVEGGNKESGEELSNNMNRQIENLGCEPRKTSGPNRRREEGGKG